MAWLSSMISSRDPTPIGDPRRSSILVRSSSCFSSRGFRRSMFETYSSSISSQSLIRSSRIFRSLHLLLGATCGSLNPPKPLCATFLAFFPTRVGGAGGSHCFFFSWRRWADGGGGGRRGGSVSPRACSDGTGPPAAPGPRRPPPGSGGSGEGEGGEGS